MSEEANYSTPTIIAFVFITLWLSRGDPDLIDALIHLLMAGGGK